MSPTRPDPPDAHFPKPNFKILPNLPATRHTQQHIPNPTPSTVPTLPRHVTVCQNQPLTPALLLLLSFFGTPSLLSRDLSVIAATKCRTRDRGFSRKIQIFSREFPEMDGTFFDLMEFWKRPSITETLVDILLCAVPIWLAVMIGLVIGWSWRPRWTGLVFLGFRSKFRFIWTAPPGFGARRLWLAFTALSAFSACRAIWNNLKGKDSKSAPAASAPPPTANTTARSSGEEGGVDIRSVLVFMLSDFS